VGADGPRARQAKSKARLAAYDALLNEAFEARAANLEIAIPNGPRLATSSSRRTTWARAMATRVLIDDLSFKLPRGGIVGVIGPNGAGRRRSSA